MSAAPLPTTDHSMALLQDMLRQLPSAVLALQAIRDPEGTILDYQTTYYNDAALTLLGYTPEQLKRQLLFQHSPHLRELTDRLSQVANQQETLDFPYFLPAQNQWFELGIRPVSNGFFISFQPIRTPSQPVQQVPTHRQAILETDRQQQLLLHTAFTASPVGITVEQAIRDAMGNITDFQAILINPVALAMGGHTEQEVLTQTISQLNPLFESSGLLAAYRAVINTGQPFQIDFQQPHTNRYLELTVSPVDADTLIAVFTDITQRRKAQLDLKQQNDLFKGVMETSLNGITIYEAVRDEQGQIVDFQYIAINEAGLAQSPLTRAEIEAKGTILGLHPQTKEAGLFKEYIAVCETGDPFRKVLFYPIFNRWYDVAVSKHADGIIVTYNDVTASKQASAYIEKQAFLFDGVLLNMKGGLSVLEVLRDDAGELADLRYVRVSHDVLKDTGLTESQLVGSTMLTHFPSVKQTHYWTAYRETLRTGQPQRFEIHYQGEGIDNHLENCVSCISDTLIISSYTIVSEQKKALQQVEKLVVELRESNQSLEQFAYIASHDLQEPTRKVQMFGKVMLDQYATALPPEARDIIQRMMSGADRMQSLIRELLGFSRLSSDQEPFKLIHLNQIISDVLGDLELVIQEKQAQISVSGLPALSGNATQLRQLFQNLLTNALKFSRKGIPPIISVTALSVRPSQLPASLTHKQTTSWAAVAIQDNGIGFDQKHSERIFHLFQRLHSRNQYSGTGLGLAICKKVAENHGGLITAMSQINPEAGEWGSCFTVFLPVLAGETGKPLLP